MRKKSTSQRFIFNISINNNISMVAYQDLWMKEPEDVTEEDIEILFLVLIEIALNQQEE